MQDLRLRRPLPPGRYPILEVAAGLERSPPLCDLLGDAEKCRAFLERTTVEIVEEKEGYMWVDNDDGTIYVADHYWTGGEEFGLYLDLVHETVHVKQHHDGRDLFDRTYIYVRRPTELEAYHVVVAEARRLGMAEKDLSEFLYVEWINEEEHGELCKTLGVEWHPRPRPGGKT